MSWLTPAWEQFQDRLLDDRLAHALLVHGPEGSGKTQLARSMLETLLCSEPGPDGACGECRSCHLLVSGAHPDAFIVTFMRDKRSGKQKKEIVVEQIRELIGSLGLTTTISVRKVALIAPADAMNRNSANALLKTLEEPPGDTVIILLAHEPSRLPVTVRSRCQSVSVAMPSENDAMSWLVAEQGVDRNLAPDALRAAGGSPVRALRYHEQGLVPLHRDLDAALEEMFIGKDGITSTMGLIGDTEPDTIWRWLSGASAIRARSVKPGAGPAMDLLRLQQKADRCRRLSRTAVRGDLLLRDWLIEWCRAGAMARSQGLTRQEQQR